jgi:hypothetical protein
MRATRLALCAPAALMLAVVSVLYGCDVDLFGLDSKKVAAGYRLTQWEAPPYFVLFSPGDKDSEGASEIGWQKPFIIVRDETADRSRETWTVIDTSTGQKTRISEEQRNLNPAYREIPVHPARTAWARLKRHRNVW